MFFAGLVTQTKHSLSNLKNLMFWSNITNIHIHINFKHFFLLIVLFILKKIQKARNALFVIFAKSICINLS